MTNVTPVIHKRIYLDESFIHAKMNLHEIILGFPQKAQKLRRAIRNFASFPHDLPDESLEMFLADHGKNPHEMSPFIGRLNAILEEKTNLNAITMSEQAAIKLKEILRTEGKEGWGIKFADHPAECGVGFSNDLVLCPHSDPTDITFFSHGIGIFVPAGSIDRLLGALIDFEEGFIDEHFAGLIKLGFTIANPNVTATCKCGCSYKYGE